MRKGHSGAIGSLILVVLCTGLFRRASAQEVAPRMLRFTYTLPGDANTSAGVFDSSGELIRTLWSGEPQDAGTHNATWDGKDDLNQQRNLASPWTIKLLSNNVRYHWDGVVGNTENSWGTSADVWDGLGYKPTQLRLAFVGNVVWATTGYSEGTANLLSFVDSAPNSPEVADTRYYSQNISLVDVDSDGTYLYLANKAAWSGENFVSKLNARTGEPATFTFGGAIVFPFAWTGTKLSGIAVSPKGSPAPVALAVENQGTILAVADEDGQILFFDKNSGRPYGTSIRLPKITSMGFTLSGLWVLSGANVYLISSPGQSNNISEPLKGLSNPVFLTTNKRNNDVFILDGGLSQQVKEFDAERKLTRTFGDKGGFNDMNPNITDTRLILDNTATNGTGTGTQSWLRVSPDNEMWLCDGGNAGRILHIDIHNQVRDHVEFQQETYVIAVGQTLPQRLFRGGIEYEIDYSVPLMPGDPTRALGGNGSWRMVKNWSVGAEGAAGSKRANYQVLVGPGGITNVERLPNGHVYAHAVDSITRRLDEVELPEDHVSPMRFIATLSVNSGDSVLEPDGSLMRMVTTGTPSTGSVTLLQSPLQGFNADNDPIRGMFAPVAQVTTSAGDPLPSSGWGMRANVAPTAQGVYPVFATQPYREGAPHLAGILPGRTTYLWKVLPEGTASEGGAPVFPRVSGYGGHNGIASQAVGNNIFASYDGQYALWGNQHFHYWTDGLYIGHFGYSAGWTRGKPMPPGSAGNIAEVRFVPYQGSIYMYMTVEAGYTPVQRWSISNLGSIREYVGTGTSAQVLILSLTCPLEPHPIETGVLS